MSRSRRDPCCICGKRHTGRCSPKALAAIDRANRRAADGREPRDAGPSIGDRLALGFRWMHAIADQD
jgi:hypothetical protein